MPRSDNRNEPRSTLPPLPSPLDRISRLGLKPERDHTGLHFIEGIRPVMQALDAGLHVETLIYSEILCRNPYAQKRVRVAKRAGVPVARLTPEDFRRIEINLNASARTPHGSRSWVAPTRSTSASRRE